MTIIGSQLSVYFFMIGLSGLIVGISGCDPDHPDPPSLSWIWNLPEYVSPPIIPEDNPMSVAKVELGRHLFYEKRLSMNGELSCESCHEQARSFSVPEATHEGADGERTPRNAPSLANIAYASYLTWSNLTTLNLEHQMLNPLFGDNPIELGVGFIEGSSDHYNPQRLITLTEEHAKYRHLFARAFPEQDQPITWENVIKAIACFQRALISFRSPWDHWLNGDPSALSEAQERGRQLFFSSRLGCGTCHSGPLLSLAFPTDQSTPDRRDVFRNTGLYYLSRGELAYLDGSRSTYPPPNQGIGEFSQRVADDGKHRIPSLRNITLTAPYMHDGSVTTLDEVIDHYARGGRMINAGPLRGDGRDNPYKDPLIMGFILSDVERADLKAFFEALTDDHFTRDTQLSAPPQIK